MLSSSNKEAFLTLVRSGIGHQNDALAERIDWGAIEELAGKQGLSAILVDGIERLPDNKRPPKEVLLQWIGETLQSYEYRYKAYKKNIAEMAAFYNQHGYKMMVIKGYACSLDWPKPDHRPCGDIDIWQYGKQKEADALIAKEKGIKVDNSHHHHSVFYWGEFMVENHFDFVNVYAHKSSRELEKIFKALGNEDSHFIEVEGEKVYLPCPNLHALFLIKHMISHFAAAEITLRQVLDWAFFVEKHSIEIDWEWLEEMLDKYHMKDFYNCINAICVGDLGFNENILPMVRFDYSLKEKVLLDILSPEFVAAEPRGFLKRIVYKYSRWQGNAWKQELCYSESRWSAFWNGVWAKILKPTSF